MNGRESDARGEVGGRARPPEANDNMISSLKSYLKQSFPSVYYRSNSYFDRMVTEICNNHSYIEIFVSAGDSSETEDSSQRHEISKT
jgi:hypothetical protein